MATMDVATAPSMATSVAPEGRRLLWPAAATLFFLALLWGEVALHLHSEWSYDPQYSYGWMVPLFAVFFGWRRWSTRPSPGPSSFRWLAFALIIGGALLL